MRDREGESTNIYVPRMREGTREYECVCEREYEQMRERERERV